MSPAPGPDRALRGALVALTLVALTRLSGTSRHPWFLGVQGVARLALLPAWPLALLAARRRAPRSALVGVGLALLQLRFALSSRGRGRPDPLPAGAHRLRLVTANLLLTNPRLDEAAHQLLADRPDVLVLQELTPDHLTRLRTAGVLDRLPHHVLDARTGYHGSAVLARWPVTDPAVLDVEGRPMAAGTVATPAGPLRVVAVHGTDPAAPGELGRWRRQLRRLGQLAARSPVPVVLAGDYNATADHADFRRLLAVGLRDAPAVAGRGGHPSWPVWRAPFPRLMQLDHVLVPPAVLVRAATSEVTAGSDHRRLVVELALPAAEGFRGG